MKVFQKVSSRLVREVLNQDFPQFLVKTIELKPAGKDNNIVEINNQYIFRFPKKESYPLDTEINVLKLLKGKVTLAIPDIKYIGRTACYIGYPKIPGDVLTSARFNKLSLDKKHQVARDLALFLFEIHQSINIPDCIRLGIQKRVEVKLDAIALHTILKTNSLKYFSNFAQIIYSRLKEELPTQNSYSVLYNDLHEGNIAFDIKAQKINGIFDFGDMRIGTIENDFTDLCKIDINLTNLVVKIYNELSGKNLDITRIFAIAWTAQMKCLLDINSKTDRSFYKFILNRLMRWTKSMQIAFL